MEGESVGGKLKVENKQKRRRGKLQWKKSELGQHASEPMGTRALFLHYMNGSC